MTATSFRKSAEPVSDRPAKEQTELEKAYRPGVSSMTLRQRRWQSFKNNKRGYYSALIFLSLFIFTLMAEFISNDRPIILHVDGKYYFPVFFSYPETAFADESVTADRLFETEVVYRDPFFIRMIKEKGGWMVWPPIRYANNTINLYLKETAPASPSREHIFGTDDIGRDVFARVIYGFRLSIIFGLGLTICCSIIGITAGAIQGYFGGLVDLIFQRIIEMWANLPMLFLLIILASLVEPSPRWLFLLLLLFNWMALVGVVRAEFLRARNLEYVRAARALGVGNALIMYKHVLPNAMAAALTMVPFILTRSVITLTALDFLGFGLPPDAPSLGRLIKSATSNLQAPWLGFTSFFSIGILLTLLIFVGEAVRDAFDPRKAVQFQ